MPGGIPGVAIGVFMIVVALIAAIGAIRVGYHRHLPAPLIGGLIGYFSGGWYGESIGIAEPIVTASLGGLLGVLLMMALLEVDSRLVDTGGLAGALVAGWIATVVVADLATILTVTALGGAVLSGVSFTPMTALPRRSLNALRTMAGESTISGTGSPDHVPGYDPPTDYTDPVHRNLREAIDPTEDEAWPFAISYPIAHDLGPFIAVSLIVLALVAVPGIALAPILTGTANITALTMPVIAGLLLPVVGALATLSGYYFRVAAAAANGYETPPRFVQPTGMTKEGAAFWVAALPIVVVLFGPIAYAFGQFGPSIAPLLEIARDVPVNIIFFSYVMGQLGVPIWLTLFICGSLAHLILPAFMLAYVTTGRMRGVYAVPRLRRIVTSPVYREHQALQALITGGLIVGLPLTLIVGLVGLGIYLPVALYGGAVSAALWGRAWWAIDHGQSSGTVELFSTRSETSSTESSDPGTGSTEDQTDQSTSGSTSPEVDDDDDVFDRHAEQWHIPDSDTYDYAVEEPDDGYRYYKTKRGARKALRRWYD